MAVPYDNVSRPTQSRGMKPQTGWQSCSEYILTHIGDVAEEAHIFFDAIEILVRLCAVTEIIVT